MGALGRGRQYTLILIGDQSSSVRKFQLAERSLRRVAVLVAVVALVGTGTLAWYVRRQAAIASAHGDPTALREENRQLREQLHAFEDRVARITATLDRVSQLDATLRGTSRELEGPAAPSKKREGSSSPAVSAGPAAAGAAPGGIGGPVSESPDVEARLGSLERAATRQQSSLSAFNEYFDAQRSLLATTPTEWPARGWVTSDFGERLDPYTAERMMHRGLDIGSRPGDPVVAPSDAVVKFAGNENGYGKVLVLDHGHGVTTRYGHLSAIYVKAGQRVKRGQRMAAVGNTGRSTGPHLHYEVRVNGEAENPRKFLME